MKLFKQAAKYGAALSAFAAGSLAYAAAPVPTINLAPITSAFNAADVIAAVMSVAAVLAAIYATMTAAKMALRWIRGG